MTKTIATFAAVLGYTVLATNAQAEEISRFYLDLGAGASISKGNEATRNASIFANRGKAKHEAGRSFSAALGYWVCDDWRADLSFNYLPSWRVKESRVMSTLSLPYYYQGNISSLATMLNLSYDFNQFAINNITPYVTAGVGITSNKTSNTDVFVNNELSEHMLNNTSHNFSWKIGLGASYQLNDRVALDLGYRLAALGKAKTKLSYDSVTLLADSTHNLFKNLYSNQIVLTARLSF